MVQTMLFLHVLGAIAAGFYLLLPFLLMSVDKLSAAAQGGYVQGMVLANRIGQYILIVQLLTGGYLISKQEYAVWWIVAIIVLFLVVSALAGIMSKPMKRLVADTKEGKSATQYLGKIKTFSTIISVVLLVLIYLMSFPAYR
jgi:nitrogen fixation/metabolism regulation signal transduction histidine kinase